MNKTSISITLLAIALASTSFAGATLYQKTKKAEVEIEKINQELNIAHEGLASLEKSNNDLSEELNQEKNKNNELSSKNSKLDEENEELEKLAKMDKQLLGKYSKVFFLNEHYTPKSLEEIENEFKFDQSETVEILSKVEPFLSDLLEEALDDGVTILIASGYRSFAEQTSLKGSDKFPYGAGTANQFSADQGYSEHQLGTTVDFIVAGGSLSASFDQTQAFKWLSENAYKYGFVLSYPKGNTYYSYEPWHWRFVGQDLARYLHKKNLHFYDMDQRDIDKYLLEMFD